MDNGHVSCFLCSLAIFDNCRLQPTYPWPTYNFLKATMKKQISQTKKPPPKIHLLISFTENKLANQVKKNLINHFISSQNLIRVGSKFQVCA